MIYEFVKGFRNCKRSTIYNLAMGQNQAFPESAQPANLPFSFASPHLASPHPFLFPSLYSTRAAHRHRSAAQRWPSRLPSPLGTGDREDKFSPTNSKTKSPLKSQQTPR
jgi:hypothetical protein